MVMLRRREEVLAHSPRWWISSLGFVPTMMLMRLPREEVLQHFRVSSLGFVPTMMRQRLLREEVLEHFRISFLGFVPTMPPRRERVPNHSPRRQQLSFREVVPTLSSFRRTEVPKMPPLREEEVS